MSDPHYYCLLAGSFGDPCAHTVVFHAFESFLAEEKFRIKLEIDRLHFADHIFINYVQVHCSLCVCKGIWWSKTVLTSTKSQKHAQCCTHVHTVLRCVFTYIQSHLVYPTFAYTYNKLIISTLPCYLRTYVLSLGCGQCTMVYPTHFFKERMWLYMNQDTLYMDIKYGVCMYTCDTIQSNVCTHMPLIHFMCICHCTHTHTYIRTYIYIHTYVHTYIYTYIYTYIHTYVHTCIHKTTVHLR